MLCGLVQVEWFLNDEPLLFKSNYGPVYDHGFLCLAITKVDFKTKNNLDSKELYRIC
jgi:hypothetical protein